MVMIENGADVIIQECVFEPGFLKPEFDDIWPSVCILQYDNSILALSNSELIGEDEENYSALKWLSDSILN